MKTGVPRAYVVELVAVFALVYLSAGIVCVNQMTVPINQSAENTALTVQQPGLVGVAMAQGFVLAVLLAATMHVSGGYLNPAITIMLWVFNRLDSARAAWLMGAQLLGGVLAGACLCFTFSPDLLQETRLATPHLNSQAFPILQQTAELKWGEWLQTLLTGISIELVLTFLLVFAIFGSVRKKSAWQNEASGKTKKADADAASQHIDARLAAIMAGAAMTASVLFAWPLTGAALNPARWFGTAVWEALRRLSPPNQGAFSDALVYTAGPILGALAAGVVCFFLIERQKQDAKS